MTKKQLEQEVQVLDKWLNQETEKYNEANRRADKATQEIERMHEVNGRIYKELEFFKELCLNQSKALAGLVK
jgi:hypothetical protein